MLLLAKTRSCEMLKMQWSSQQRLFPAHSLLILCRYVRPLVILEIRREILLTLDTSEVCPRVVPRGGVPGLCEGGSREI